MSPFAGGHPGNAAACQLEKLDRYITNGLISLNDGYIPSPRRTPCPARYGQTIGRAVELSSATNGLMSLNDGYVPSLLMSPFCGLQGKVAVQVE